MNNQFPTFLFGFWILPSLSCRLPLTTHPKFPGHEKMRGKTTNFPHFCFGFGSSPLSLLPKISGARKNEGKNNQVPTFLFWFWILLSLSLLPKISRARKSEPFLFFWCYSVFGGFHELKWKLLTELD